MTWMRLRAELGGAGAQRKDNDIMFKELSVLASWREEMFSVWGRKICSRAEAPGRREDLR
jgi:hypothetical protein